MQNNLGKNTGKNNNKYFFYRITKIAMKLVNISQSSFEWRRSPGSLRQLVTTNWAGFCSLGIHRIIWSCQC